MELTPVQIVADGVRVQAAPGQNLLEACLAAGRDVPYFCWHPALGSAGACRQCAVRVFTGPDDETGQIVMACMTKITPEMRVAVADPAAAAFREQTIEFVLTNHPHDCPVCEVGGECHLQDMTALTGHVARRYRFAKRTHLNQNLGPFIRHEMNRCIGCYRCVRFYRDYAGGSDFGVFGANRNVYFGRAENGALESAFAGNLVEVCPTGVFVDKPFSARFARKWDMRATPAVCPLCAVGCNISLQERGGAFRRVSNRFNESLNGYFLCDRGRFGAGFVAGAARLGRSWRMTGGRVALDAVQAQAALAGVLRKPGAIGIGSPRASMEANFALRAAVGSGNFYAGVAAAAHEAAAVAISIMRGQGAWLADLREAGQADAVLILGDDPSGVAPRLALALRQAANRPPADVLDALGVPAWQADAAARAGAAAKIPFMIAAAAPGRLDDAATVIRREMPDVLVQLAFAIARQIDAGAPGADVAAAGAFARALTGAKTPLIVAGAAACGPALLQGAANIVQALRNSGVAAQMSLLLPEANSLGLGMMAPQPLSGALAAMQEGRPAVILENDLHRRVPQAALAASFSAASAICVLDHVETATAREADIVLAVGSFADGEGTMVNLEGRAQRSYKAIFGEDDPLPAWALLRDAGVAAGRLPAGTWPAQAALLADMGVAIPELAGCAAAAMPVAAVRTASLPYRYSGRTAQTAQTDVREPAPPPAVDSPFGTTMEGDAQLRAPGWNSVQAVNRFAPVRREPEVFLFDNAAAGCGFFAPPIASEPGGLVFVPVEDVFGSEELSVHAPAIAERMGKPHVTLAPGEAARIGVRAGDAVVCETAGLALRRFVRVDPGMPDGVAAVVSGFPGETQFAAGPGDLRLVAP